MWGSVSVCSSMSPVCLIASLHSPGFQWYSSVYLCACECVLYVCVYYIHVCVCEPVCLWISLSGGSDGEDRHIGKVWLGMETAIIFLLAKKQAFPHPFSLLLILSRTHSLQLSLSLSLFLYHLQRQPFPPKWGHARKVCKWNHCLWIRMGHHIP